MTKDKNLLYENDEFVIFYKNADENFHSEGEKGFVVKASELLQIKLYSVHRLDKMTSGLIILAKNSKSASLFAKMFENRKIEKYYLAISTKKPKKKQGWIKADMTSARRGSYKLLNSKENPAITQFISKNIKANERLFLIKPHTGKTHQIRVALKSISGSICGDIRYSNANEAKLEDRGYLHAYALKFIFNDKNYDFLTLPKEGKKFLSEDFLNSVKEYQKPWELFK